MPQMTRSTDPQNNVVQALRGMGFTDAADRYTHFSYEMVALSLGAGLGMIYDSLAYYSHTSMDVFFFAAVILSIGACRRVYASSI